MKEKIIVAKISRQVKTTNAAKHEYTQARAEAQNTTDKSLIIKHLKPNPIAMFYNTLLKTRKSSL